MLSEGRYRIWEDIYDRLLISPKPLPIYANAEDPYFSIWFHVWKPTPNFKKSNPGPPDFYISIVSTKSTTLPSVNQIESIFRNLPETDTSQKLLYQSLKEGKKSFVLAIVDFGVISYMRFADSVFPNHRLDANPPPPKNRGSGKFKENNRKEKKSPSSAETKD
jgi:tRNA-splicing endonuclease subunit Sen54